LGRLGGGAMRGAYLALETIIFTLAGSPLFYFPAVFGWTWFDAQGRAEDIKRELSFASFSERARKEPDTVLPAFNRLMESTDHPLFRDSHEQESIPHVNDNFSIVSYARFLETEEFGREMAVVAVNLSKQTQFVRLQVPVERLGEGPLKDRYFILYDLIDQRLHFHTGEELQHLPQELQSEEARVYLVREIVEPSTSLRRHFDRTREPAWVAQGIRMIPGPLKPTRDIAPKHQLPWGPLSTTEDAGTSETRSSSPQESDALSPAEGGASLRPRSPEQKGILVPPLAFILAAGLLILNAVGSTDWPQNLGLATSVAGSYWLLILRFSDAGDRLRSLIQGIRDRSRLFKMAA